MATLLRAQRASWRDYLELTKPKVVVLMLITSLVGMFLATRAGVAWSVLLFGNLGIGLCAGAAAAVNHVVDHRTIAFRTAPGTKLSGLERMVTTCFEADAIDVDRHAGWSVVVKGRVHEVTDPEELRHLGELPLALWTTGAKDHWVRIRPTEVTGRRIHNAEGVPA